MNAELEWFASFVCEAVGPDGVKKITQAANERYDQIVAAVEMNPLAPSSIAERVLEWVLNSDAIAA